MTGTASVADIPSALFTIKPPTVAAVMTATGGRKIAVGNVLLSTMLNLMEQIYKVVQIKTVHVMPIHHKT